MGECRILSTSDEPFRDRVEAGRLLAEALSALRGRRPVVLGVPRGGLVIAREVARGLDGELDVVLAHKLRAPANPEFAIGAIGEDGAAFLSPDAGAWAGADEAYVRAETERQLALLAARAEAYRHRLPRVALAGRLVVVTDDGVATGATLQAALRCVRRKKPEELIAAVPVGSLESLERLAGDADEVVCLRAPRGFRAVGQFYVTFGQTPDDEALAIVSEAAESGRPTQ